MNNEIAERLKTLRFLHGNRNQITLKLSELRELDRYLHEEWGIKVRSHEQNNEELNYLPERLCNRFVPVLNKRADLINAGEAVPVRLEKRFYDMLAIDSIGGIMHSRKRAFILEGISWVTAVLSKLKIRHSVLDIGCHTGYQTKYYATKLDVDVVGVDRNKKAISRAKVAGNGVKNLDFLAWDFTKKIPKANEI